MPEIKHVFQDGRMEKDLDERLVRNGQYRDAMNIQVSTSEGSDVGTVQNILGNENLFSNNQLAPGSKCVAAIADEKEDCFYWFVYHNTKNLILKYQKGQVEFVFVDTMNVLNFSGDIITGINVIDDFLLWTDNWSEPKKINIQRSIDGTRGGSYHTHLIVPRRNIRYEDCIKVREEHITVIKKSPKSKLTVEAIFDKNITAKTDTDFKDNQGNVFVVGSEYDVIFYDFNSLSVYSLNDIIIITNDDDEQIARVQITGVSRRADDIYQIKLLSLSVASSSVLTYKTKVEDVIDLFERKFVRFGYRYKFNDGEYSSFSSFTDVVFKPDLFEYNSTDAYNKAMENKLVSLKIRNFISKEMPEDVVQVDILYTESTSPTVYIVDKLKYSDPKNVTTGNVEKNYMQANMYEVTSDLIYSVVANNQLIRPFDNVPRKAVAQEITGNRVVYANYLQNYNIDEKPILESSYVPRFVNNGTFIHNYFLDQTETPIPQLKLIEYLYGQKSLKSLRNYQLGLTYLDEYNRETPIFTGAESIFRIPKKFADNKLKIEGQVKTLPPSWAKSFKVYIKETSTEYYNLAMSRVYKAEDGNIWLSFPSSERNKVDEETFLILKKAIDTNNLVEEEAKYKVLAIENEAPEYISNEKTSFVQINCGSTNATNVFGVYGPTVSSKNFRIVDSSWLTGGTESMELIEDKLSVAFKNTSNNNFTTTYEIKSISLDGSYYKITLDRAFETQDAEFIYPNYPTTTNSGVLDLDSNLKMIIYKTESVKESSQFKGMFFVKINNDQTIENKVISSQTFNDYEIVNTMPTHSFIDGWTGSSLNNTSYGRTSTLDHWRDLLSFGGSDNNLFPTNHPPVIDNDVHGGFFIDEAFYIDIQTGGGAQYMDELSDGHVLEVYRNVVREWWNAHLSGDYWDFYNNPPFELLQYIFDYYAHVRRVHPNQPNYGTFGSGPIQNLLSSTIGGGIPQGVSVFPQFYGGYAPNPKFGKGIYEENGKHYVEVSFSEIGDTSVIKGSSGKINPNNSLRYGNSNNSSAFDIRNNVEAKQNYAELYSASDNELVEIASNISTGKRFKVRSDDDITNIYTVKSVQRIKRYNFVSFFEVVYRHEAWKDQNPGGSQGSSEWNRFNETWEDFMAAENRRYTFIIELDHSLNDVQINNKGITHADNSGIAKSLSFQFLEPKYNESTKQKISDNPAIWETEPKESADLDIYYEASGIIPLQVNDKTNTNFIPLGSVVTCPARPGVVTALTYVTAWDNKKISFNIPINLNAYSPPGQSAVRVFFTRPDSSYTTIEIDTVSTLAETTIAPNTYVVNPDVSRNPFALSWYNSFSFGNGVESNRIRDDFNQPIIDKGVKVSTVIEENYEEERRASGLIYSGIYNTIPGVNNLNQFIQAEKITKDLNPSYGSIQKLHSRSTADGDLIALCEDRVIKILANKDALFNADGNTNITSTNNVLGQAIPYSGEYGISKNPESFAAESYRAYFTDKQRGAVLRLSRDGLTPISDIGMSDYFKDTLKFANKIIGSYDDKKGEYNVTIPLADTTVSFKESTKSWSSFKSFVAEQAISMASDYYTFKDGLPYKHHVEKNDKNDVYRNTFYGVYTPSSIDVLLNDLPSSIKSYRTLNYEGSQSKVNQETTDVSTGYYNIIKKDGWHSVLIQTDKQKGYVPEFIEKEGKWFNYIKGINVDQGEDLKTEEFSFQGVGRVIDFKINLDKYQRVVGCMDPAASNYNEDATVDNGLCEYILPEETQQIGGCMDITDLANYNPLATFDDGSCEIVCEPVFGCTNPIALNYNPLATDDDGSCELPIYGCTDPRASNYNPLANIDDGTCYLTDDPSDPTDPDGDVDTGRDTDGDDNSEFNATFTVKDINDPDTNTIPPPNN